MRGGAYADDFNGGGAVTSGPIRMNGNVDGSTRVGFATSLRDTQRYLAAADAQKVASSGTGLRPSYSAAESARPNPFDVWMEGRYQGFRDTQRVNDADGHFGLVTLGADYILTPSLLVGALVQLDDLDMRSPSQKQDMRGRGWMAGPYATVRLSENVFWQSRAAWGQSSNTLRTASGFAEQFDSDRWIASSTLAGRWSWDAWAFRPSASVSYMEDVAAAHSGQNGVRVPEVKSRLGQTKAGPEVGYRYQLGDAVIEPRGGFQVIWNFANDASATGIALNNESPGAPNVRGRAEIGLRASRNGLFDLDLSGSYDGVGSSNYSALSGRANVRIPLN